MLPAIYSGVLRGVAYVVKQLMYYDSRTDEKL